MKYRLNEHIDCQPYEDHLLVLDLRGNAYYALNDTARFFMEKISQGMERSLILSEAEKKYAVEASLLTHDFDDFVSKMVSLGFISPSDTKCVTGQMA